MKSTITMLDVLRNALTPNAEKMCKNREVMPGLDRKNHPVPCKACGYPKAYIKGKNPLCAACLTLSAKMLRHSDAGKPKNNQGVIPLNAKFGGGMGVLMTEESVHFFVHEDNFDLIFLDDVPHTRCQGKATFKNVLAASLEKAMSIPEGKNYWWGLVGGNDAYEILEMLRETSWNIAQDSMVFHLGVKEAPIKDFRASWRCLAAIQRNPDMLRIAKSVQRILSKEDDPNQDKKLEKLPWDEVPGAPEIISGLSENTLHQYL